MFPVQFNILFNSLMFNSVAGSEAGMNTIYIYSNKIGENVYIMAHLSSRTEEYFWIVNSLFSD